MTATSGMNIAQRILHVGGRNNAAGYVEFGSIQAVEALVRQVLRDLQPADVPLLSDDEIYEMYSEPRSDAEMLEFGREVEAAVRKLFIATQQPAPVQESDNLKCKTVQKRLATQWGYVEAQQPAPVQKSECGRYAWVPVEPSTAMLVAGNHCQSGDYSAALVWEKMVACAGRTDCLRPVDPPKATQPAPVQELDMDYERRHAIKQGERNAAEDAYFKARPGIDSPIRRRTFCDGFDRGYDAQQPRKAVKLSVADIVKSAACSPYCPSENKWLSDFALAIQDAFIAKNGWTE